MDNDVIIKVEGLSKKFCRSLKRSMLYGTMDVARTMLRLPQDRLHLRKGEFLALDGIDFELKKGEALGIIGQNGSGKTTLLRLLSGIFPPDAGRISIRGRMGALIAVGAGFHPHMSGRENIYLNGTILGMTRREIDARFDEIVAFADIGEFIDAPVSTYSSGMTVRLGFSIAIHSNPEILLADEVLAVGDLRFAMRCFRKISEFRENGGSLILVSHGMSLIRNTCQRVLWLDSGRVQACGETQAICDLYERHALASDRQTSPEEGAVINNDPLTRITGVEFLDRNDRPVGEFAIGTPFKVRIRYDCRRPVRDPVFSFTVMTMEEVAVISDFTIFDGFRVPVIEGVGHLDYTLERLPLKPSEYRCLVTFAENGDVNNVLEWHNKTYSFVVNSAGRVCHGLVGLSPRWELFGEQKP